MTRRLLRLLAGLVATMSANAATADPRATNREGMPVSASYSWTGFYVGANAGYGWTSGQVVSTTHLPVFITDADDFSVNLKARGLIAGAQAGLNWQYAPSWVVGIEADFSYSGLSGDARHGLSSAGVASPGFHEVRQELEWFSTVRGRIGLLPHERLMIFVAGGIVLGRLRYEAFEELAPDPTSQLFGSATDTRLGWSIGGGVEWAFADRWSAKIEYLHLDLGGQRGIVQRRVAAIPNFQDQFTNVSGPFETKAHILRFGINYRFAY